MENPADSVLAGRTYLLALYSALVGGAFLSLYLPVISGLVRDWGTNANFSHGYFIPLLSGAMIYSRRAVLHAIEIRPFNQGLAVLAAGLLLYGVATVGTEHFLQRGSMIVVLFGLSLFLGGLSLTRTVGWPLAYLVLMIPLPAVVWSGFALPMQLFSSAVSEKAIFLLGIPVLREGNILHLAETSLEVVDACSGLRSLTTLFALSGAMAFFAKTSPARRAVIVFAALPVALVANILRLTGTAVLAESFGPRAAQGFLHDFSGWLVFVGGLVLLMAIMELLQRGDR